MTPPTDPSRTSTGSPSADGDALRAAVDDIANQLCRVVDGQFDFQVNVAAGDDTIDKLVMLVNLVLDVACRALDMAEERNNRLKERNKDLEQFAYVASHDLQEPLRMVSSFLQLLERRFGTDLDPTAQEYIHYAVDGAQRMQGLIRDLLSYSRIGTHGRPLEPTSSEEAFETAMQDLRVAIEEADAHVTRDALPVVCGDRAQLAQLFQNLLSNAIKFRGKGPAEVHISAEPAGTHWEFRVRDRGIGIAPEHAERIFQIFQRLHTRDDYEGTGIGLAICKKIVERHGGRIWVESEPGQGTTFHFTLPAARVDERKHG
jgi:light-regulated signal transduction histidine kinase (bacteriophytochrome)